MAKSLSKTGITTGNTVKAFHVTQSIDAFTGTEAYDIVLSGSSLVTGSSNILGTLSLDGPTGHITASGNISASGRIFGSSIRIPQGSDSTNSLFFGTSPASNNGFVYDDTTDLILGYNDTDILKIHDVVTSNGAQSNVRIDGNLKVNSHITASVNISASGNITCANLTATGITTINRVRSNNPTISDTIDFEDNILVSNGHHITASGNISSSGGFIGQATNIYRPITTLSTNPFTASNATAGAYYRAGGNITCSIFATASVGCTTGVEFEFIQTSSAGYVLFETGSGVTLNSKGSNLKLAGQFSAATLKYVGNNEWDLIGDLG